MYSTTVAIINVIKNISTQFSLNDLPSPKVGGTCVIVAPGGILLEFPGLGKVIDSYDYVIRLNMSPTKSFEVGLWFSKFEEKQIT